MASTPTLVQTPQVGLVTIINSDGSGWKTLASAGSSGSKVVTVSATSSDTAPRVVQVSILRSSLTYVLGAATVPASAGQDGATASSNLLSLIPGLPVDNDGQPYLFMQSGDALQVSSTTNVTAAKTVTVAAVYGNF